jgi:YD repeat-containing protein
MVAKYTFNPADETTGIEYEKTAHCASTCPEVWFKEAVVPSIHGEALVRATSLAKEEYTYDEAGRLTKVNEIPTGKGCKTRIYGYNLNSDRISEITRESATETCATTGGTEEKHSYDEADRPTDAGVEYEAFGNQTKTPAADAGGNEIVASFYVDNQIAAQKQNGETTSYTYDSAGRTEKTVSEGAINATVVNHYPGSGEGISWAEEEEGKSWTRNIDGINGTLAATQHNSEPAILQLNDLQGDIVATAAVSEIETKLLTKYNPTEFGVPVNGTPPTKFSWFGASGLATEQASGAANPDGGTYVPQLGRALQTQPIEPPGSIHGTYITPYISAISARTNEVTAAYAAEAPARAAARQRAAEEAACQADPDSCSEDPGWAGDVSIATAEILSGALEAIEVAYYAGDGEVVELAEKAVDILAEHLHVNFLSQLKEAFQRGVFGYSTSDVANWIFEVGGLLQTCSEAAGEGMDHPKNPHCWIYIPTTVRYAYRGGPGMEIPNFAEVPTVGYCPWGKYSKCIEVNDW